MIFVWKWARMANCRFHKRDVLSLGLLTCKSKIGRTLSPPSTLSFDFAESKIEGSFSRYVEAVNRQAELTKRFPPEKAYNPYFIYTEEAGNPISFRLVTTTSQILKRKCFVLIELNQSYCKEVG